MRIVRLIPAIAAIAVLVLLVLVFTGKSSGGYRIHVRLADADGLRDGSRVEIGGVSVGTVDTLQITAKDQALATITIDKADAPIGRDATVEIVPADLLGEKFLNLSVGNRKQPARNGYTIPTAHTQDETDFDQVFDVLAPTTRDRLAVMIHETGVALFGRAADLKSLLKALPPSLNTAQQLISQVTASNTQLEGLITHSAHVIGTLDTQQDALTHFVATGADALKATADNTSGLAQSVAEAPGLLTHLDSTLVSLDRAGTNLRPAAQGLINTAPGLTATLKALPGFATAAKPTLAEVRSIAPQLTGLGKQASPVIARLEPVAKQLQTFATDAAPITATLNSSIDDTLGTLQNWARAIQFSDGASHEFRVSAEVTPQFLTAIQPILDGTTPLRKTATKTSTTAAAPAKTSTTPANPVSTVASGVSTTVQKTTSGLSGTLSGVGSGLSKTLSGLGSTVNGVLGGQKSGSSTSTTSNSGLQNLLGYLVGSK